jgi:hypothetical protein
LRYNLSKHSFLVGPRGWSIFPRRFLRETLRIPRSPANRSSPALREGFPEKLWGRRRDFPTNYWCFEPAPKAPLARVIPWGPFRPLRYQATLRRPRARPKASEEYVSLQTRSGRILHQSRQYSRMRAPTCARNVTPIYPFSRDPTANVSTNMTFSMLKTSRDQADSSRVEPSISTKWL